MVEFVARHTRLKEVDALAVVWLRLKLQLPAIVHVLSEFSRVSTAQFLERSLNLLLFDVVVLLVLGAARKSLPGQLTLDQIKQHVADRLQIVTA